MFGGRSTDIEAVGRLSHLPRDRVKFALSELSKKHLVGSNGDNFLVYTSALDMLALKHYADADRAMALGKLIAKGKESDVYEVLSAKSELFALKFFRLGRSSFRDVRRKRASSTSETHSWVTSNYNAAKHEFAAIRRLRGFTENVPEAVDQDRHTVLLNELPGVRLAVRPELEDPSQILAMILNTERDAYVKAGMINGDLSEYNILTEGRTVWLIDWPQWVAPDHPNAGELLKRDTRAVLQFFVRAYGVGADLETAISFVKGEAGGDALDIVVKRGRSSARESAS
jgi:RIO kinase 2